MGVMNRQSTEDFQSSETILYNTVMVDTCHYTFVKLIEGTTSRLNPNVTYRLQVIMMGQYRLISFNRDTALVLDFHSREAVCIKGQKM